MADCVRIAAWVKPETREALKREAARRRRERGGGVQMADVAGIILDTAIESAEYDPAEEERKLTGAEFRAGLAEARAVYGTGESEGADRGPAEEGEGGR